MSGLWAGRSGGGKEPSCSGDELGATAIGLKAEMSDPDEAPWQDVPQEALDEVRCIEGHEAPGIASSAVAVAEGHLARFEAHQALVADGDAMRVAAEVTQHLVGAGHRCFAVDDPLAGGGLSEQLTA